MRNGSAAKSRLSKNCKSEQKLPMTATTTINTAAAVTETVVAAPAVVVMVSDDGGGDDDGDSAKQCNVMKQGASKVVTQGKMQRERY